MRIVLLVGTVVLLVLAGCAAPAPGPDKIPAAGGPLGMEYTTTPAAMTGSTAVETAMATSTPDTSGHAVETPMPDTGAGPGDRVETPAWFAIPLTEVRSGQTFMLDDFAGKVVLVETMAVWCSKCAAQQEQLAALHGLLGERDDLVSVGLDIDPNEDEQILRSFIDGRGFDWLYAVAPEDVAREIGALYGNQFLNPPSTPALIIDRHGEAHVLPFGIKSAEELRLALEPFLEEGM